jgi:hypothetical protein
VSGKVVSEEVALLSVAGSLAGSAGSLTCSLADACSLSFAAATGFSSLVVDPLFLLLLDELDVDEDSY